MTMLLLRGAVLAVLGLLAARALDFLRKAAEAIGWPYGLDYGEGIVWQQANLMLTGDAYGPIDRFPAIVFHYPPVFHLAARAIAAASGVDMLAAGRMVSAGSLLATALFIGLVIARLLPRDIPPMARCAGAATGAMAIFCMPSIANWALLMRVDTLALSLGMAGFWLGLKSFERPGLVYAAAVCFVAAVFTKQTSLAAPAALFSTMLWFKPRQALAGMAACLVLGLVALGVLQYLTGGGFVNHVLFYNINRLDFNGALFVAEIVSTNLLFIIVIAFALWTQLVEFDWRPAIFKLSAVAHVELAATIMYFVFSTLMLVMVLKSGANTNYTIEWTLVGAILIGVSMIQPLRAASAGLPARDLPLRLVFAIFGVPALLATQIGASVLVGLQLKINDERIPSRSGQMKQLSQRVQDAPKGIVSDDMVVLLRGGKRVLWEPAIFAELAGQGRWDERGMVARVEAGEFSMFITEGHRGQMVFDSRYSPAMGRAIDAAYPVKEILAGYTLHLPRP